MPEDNSAAPVSTDATNPPAVASDASVADGAKAADTNDGATSSVVVDPTAPDEQNNVTDEGKPLGVGEIPAEVARKINESHNVLIALSSDPSVDEMAAAIGLSLYLDKLGKRATAIYSGSTPNALEFLKPEETFEATADTLQDFVIALNKDKADHLRYKLDGDFVKIYITPYKTRIAEEDLEFSYGDFNVDLVLALDVANGIDLDAALREHGRIMHDASIVNITTGKPGKFGEIEWSDKDASSVSEMIAGLLFSINSTKAKMEKEEATAFLTGIVAATNRFANAKATPATLRMSSRLMEAGANQQLVAKNITPDTDNEMFNFADVTPAKVVDTDPTKLDVEHQGEEGVDETKIVNAKVAEKESTLLDDLKEAEANLAQTGAETTPEDSAGMLEINSDNGEIKDIPAEDMAEPIPMEVEPATEAEPVAEPANEPEPAAEAEPVAEPEPATEAEPASEAEPATESESKAETEPANADEGIRKPEKVLQPTGDGLSYMAGETEKYSKMLTDALGSEMPVGNPAMMSAPAVPSAPEINGVPEMNYTPAPGATVLPPPPAPPVGMGEAMPGVPQPPQAMGAMPVPDIQPIMPAAPPAPETLESLGSQPAMQDQVYGPQSADPGAFQIPGM